MQRLIVGLGLAGLLILATPRAEGVTFCVHDNAEFASALFTAATNGSLDTVKMAQGTYTLSSDILYVANAGEGGLILSGGWDSSCFTRNAAASNTVIDGSNTYGPDFYTAGALTFDALHFYRIRYSRISADDVKILRSVFDGTPGDTAVQIESSSGQVLLDSNAFDGKNVTLRSFDGTDASPIQWSVINNTFVNAIEGGPSSLFRKGYGLYLTSPGTGSNLQILLANNVAWGNQIGGIHIDRSPSALVTHNQWQSFDNADNVTLANGSDANVTGDPQLDANLRPITPGSPVINSGTNVFPGGVGTKDAAGGKRWVGSEPDRGAYESAADDASVITVTTIADSGACPSATTCSLRAALTAPAAAGNAQRIAFNLPACPATINVNSALPSVVDTLEIDGYSQPGAVANSLDAGSDARLCVILRGNYASSRGLLADGSNSRLTVRGLAFQNFSAAALEASDGYHHVIQGNQFGSTLAVGANGSVALAANARNIYLHDQATEALVGGADAAQRNVIAGATAFGVEIVGPTGSHMVRNNYIGLAPNGNAPAGNNVGVYVTNYFNTVQDNVISANLYDGVEINTSAGQGNVIYGNTIGLPATGLADVGNGGAGVRFAGSASNNLVGVNLTGIFRPNDIAANGINSVGGASNGDGGVSVESGTGNRIAGNRIYANYGINIDLGHDGTTANDATDSDTGPNQKQNYPVLARISHVGDLRKVSGSLYASRGMRVEVFGATACGNSGRGNAQAILSSGTRALIAPTGGGNVNFSLAIARGPGAGIDGYCRLSATATSVDTDNLVDNNDTSELSTCFVDDTVFAHGFDSAQGWACAP